MFKYLAFLISLFAIIVVLPTTGEVFAQPAPAQNQSPPPNQAPISPTLDKLSADVQALVGLSQQIKQISERKPLDPYVAIALFIVLGICLLGALFVWQWRRDQSQAKEEKDLEALRISYGFWLVVGALLITFLVLVVTLTAFAPTDPKTTDIVAIIGAATGVIGTLTAAFFGIQAAGAGRSQAMTALGALKSQETLATAPGKFEPPYGPHSGDTRISITGNGFTGANAANFGVTPGASFEFVNDGLIRVTSPRAPDGVDEAKVTLVFPGSSPPNREVGAFYYYTIDPCHGPEGQTVTIRGSGLKDVKAVKFGKKEVPVPADPKRTRELKVQTPSRQDAGNDEVDVMLIFPVDSPTNFFVVGKYHYDNVIGPG